MKRRILIVDDEFGLAETIAELLAERGHEAVIAINGRLGLMSLEAKKADLVLLDVMMPVMSGLDMARAMRETPALAAIPIVLMTAASRAIPGDTPPLHDAFMHKPFTPEELFATIDRLLGADPRRRRPSRRR
jgi:CheY-like chemotaxis protein